ncbi:hypothetical protein [Rhizobium sp. Root483D2]|uniref:hypothetical protein n=1 Tax=Rhizobium sp. Root483D2 TaxID=1736545 RepID=UPI000A56E951|nr:hypothetical protein [Rhizobium sp. Root483D2]
MFKRIPEYRIRWGLVHGSWIGRRRMCLAEKRVRFLWLIPMWWPLEHADWRFDEKTACADISADIEFCMPLPASQEIRP